MGDIAKNVRGASYPVIDLKKAVELIEMLLSAIGKASASKEDVAKALGYSGVNGKSKRVIAALIQYGLINGRASEHKLTELSLQLLFPDDDRYKREAIRRAAMKPGLFKVLIDKYAGGTIPGLLSNILVTSHGINPSSGEDAVKVFRSTLEYAGLLDQEGRIIVDGTDYNSVETDQASSEVVTEDVQLQSATASASSDAFASTGDAMIDGVNRIEIVIRNGVKAGIYAPAGLTVEEKEKLKTIIDLL